jgi:hypothetical protein
LERRRRDPRQSPTAEAWPQEQAAGLGERLSIGRERALPRRYALYEESRRLRAATKHSLLLVGRRQLTRELKKLFDEN